VYLRVVICAHCKQPQRGRASICIDDDLFYLCHPNEGMDCYRLVTIYQHTLSGPCPCLNEAPVTNAPVAVRCRRRKAASTMRCMGTDTHDGPHWAWSGDRFEQWNETASHYTFTHGRTA
jgi:hypothetical protein